MDIASNQAPRSTFVTVVAWVFIVLAGFAALVSAMQNVMVHIMFKQDEMQKAASQMPPNANMPAITLYMMNHFEAVTLAFLIITLVALVAAIGLLKRQNWARLAFIVVLGIGVIWNVASIVMTAVMFNSMPLPLAAPGAPDMASMGKIMMFFSGGLAVAIAALFVWIIVRLCSEKARAEFA